MIKYALLTVTYGGLFYDGPALSVTEQIHKAKELGFDGLSIETKRPVGSPLDLDAEDRAEIKKTARSEGIELCALESLSNFASPTMEVRENNLAMMREIIELAVDLDIDLIKIFAAWPGIKDDEDDTAIYNQYERHSYYKRDYPADLRRWNRAVAGIREAADRAADRSITLALQNHPPVTVPGYEKTLAMMRDVDRENVKLCMDVPWFTERQSDEYIEEAVEACGTDIVLTHYSAWNFRESDSGEPVQDVSPAFGGRINYEAYIRALQEMGYEGYLVSEYCLPCIKNHEVAGIEEIDKANRVALGYMKDMAGATQPLPRGYS